MLRKKLQLSLLPGGCVQEVELKGTRKLVTCEAQELYALYMLPVIWCITVL